MLVFRYKTLVYRIPETKWYKEYNDMYDYNDIHRMMKARHRILKIEKANRQVMSAIFGILGTLLIIAL